MNYNIQLNQGELQLVVNALLEVPAKHSYAVIGTIKQQAEEQENAQREKVEEIKNKK